MRARLRRTLGKEKRSQEVKVRGDQGSCPLLEGVFVSIMRRIFNPGYHKVKDKK